MSPPSERRRTLKFRGATERANVPSRGGFPVKEGGAPTRRPWQREGEGMFRAETQRRGDAADRAGGSAQFLARGRSLGRGARAAAQTAPASLCPLRSLREIKHVLLTASVSALH